MLNIQSRDYIRCYFEQRSSGMMMILPKAASTAFERKMVRQGRDTLLPCSGLSRIILRITKVDTLFFAVAHCLAVSIALDGTMVVDNPFQITLEPFHGQFI